MFLSIFIDSSVVQWQNILTLFEVRLSEGSVSTQIQYAASPCAQCQKVCRDSVGLRKFPANGSVTTGLQQCSNYDKFSKAAWSGHTTIFAHKGEITTRGKKKTLFRHRRPLFRIQAHYQVCRAVNLSFCAGSGTSRPLSYSSDRGTHTV